MSAEIDQQTDNSSISPDARLGRLVSLGFHGILGKTPEAYMEDFCFALDEARFVEKDRVGELVLVEPRISIEEQLGLLGIGLDPAVFSHFPQVADASPYVADVLFINNPGTKSPRELTEELDGHFRAATLFEVLAIGRALVDRVQPFGVPVPEKPLRHFVFEKWLGNPRLSHMRSEEWRTIDLVAARKIHVS